MPRPTSLATKALIYVPLTLFALVTLVPFAYMIASALKPKSVFFSSAFLPRVSLFEIDPATGDLAVGDATRLPEAGRSKLYELTVVKRLGNAETARKTVTLAWGDVEGGADFTIPPKAEVNTPLGRVEFAAPPVESAADKPRAADVGGADNSQGAADPAAMAESDDAVVPAEVTKRALDAAAGIPAAGRTFDAVSYAVVAGNEAGTFGVAWGLLTLDNFDRLFNGVPANDVITGGDRANAERVPTGVGRAIVNSFFLASVSSVLATLGAAMGGYALAKFRFRGRGLIDNTVLASLVIPGALLIAPGYQLLYWLGLLDTYTGLILPGVAPAFGVYLFRQAMITSLPSEMIEAARIDGCGEIKLFFLMALPMVRPMAGAFLLITYLASWNNFIGPQIILQSPDKYPLAVWISQLRGVYGIDYGLIMAGTLVAVAPVLVLFLLLQKEFIAGLTAGAVKG